MKYEVGDVLYLLAKKNNKIVPSRVDAIITVKKIGGEEVTHELSVPGVDRATVLEKLDVIPFSSVSDLRTHMLGVLERKIDDEIKSVLSIASAAWPREDAHAIPEKKTEPLTLTEQPEEPMLVELPNGQMGKLHLPKELM